MTVLPTVTDPSPKVVDLQGHAVDVTSDTSPEIMGLIEGLRSIAAGEKHLAVGFFVVDAMGRVWTNFRLETGSLIDSVGGASLLQHRILKEYEKQNDH